MIDYACLILYIFWILLDPCLCFLTVSFRDAQGVGRWSTGRLDHRGSFTLGSLVRLPLHAKCCHLAILDVSLYYLCLLLHISCHRAKCWCRWCLSASSSIIECKRPNSHQSGVMQRQGHCCTDIFWKSINRPKDWLNALLTSSKYGTVEANDTGQDSNLQTQIRNTYSTSVLQETDSWWVFLNLSLHVPLKLGEVPLTCATCSFYL